MQSPAAIAAPALRHPFRDQYRTVHVERLRHEDDSDWKLFLLSFAAFFTCFYTFIF